MIVKAMWVLTIKRDGTYKTRIVARGDKQPQETYNLTDVDMTDTTLEYPVNYPRRIG